MELHSPSQFTTESKKNIYLIQYLCTTARYLKVVQCLYARRQDIQPPRAGSYLEFFTQSSGFLKRGGQTSEIFYTNLIYLAYCLKSPKAKNIICIVNKTYILTLTTFLPSFLLFLTSVHILRQGGHEHFTQ